MYALRRSARPLTVLGLLLALLLSLTACVHEDRAVTLNSDGSGSYVLTIGFSEQLVSLASDQISSTMDDFGAKVKQQGGSYRHYDDTGYSYWAYTRPFATIGQLNQLLLEAPQSGGSGGGASGGSGGTVPATTSDTFTFTQQSGFLSNTFHVTGHMSMVIPQGSLGDTGGVDMTPYLKDMRESFSVTMPGSITSHQGGSVSGNTVTYTIHYGEQTDIDVVGGGLNLVPAIPYAIGAGVVIVLLLILAGVLLWRRRKRAANLRAEQAPAPAYAPVYTPAVPDAPTVEWPSDPPAPEAN